MQNLDALKAAMAQQGGGGAAPMPPAGGGYSGGGMGGDPGAGGPAVPEGDPMAELAGALEAIDAGEMDPMQLVEIVRQLLGGGGDPGMQG
jgi:hypothetical protein